MKGEQQEKRENKLYVGFTEVEVVSCNPKNKELKELGQYVDDEKGEVNYLDEKDGVDRVRIDFWERTTGPEKHIVKRSFWIEKRPSVSKTGKTEYINAVGDHNYVNSEADLSQRFLHFTKKETGEIVGDKEHRVALHGEGQLMDFVKKWFSNVNQYSPSFNILLDTDKLFKGNFSELRDEIDGANVKPVVENLTVRTVDKDGELKYYQGVWKTALLNKDMKSIRNVKFSDENIGRWIKEKKDKVTNPEGRYLRDYETVAVEMTTGEYKCTDFFVLGTLREYDPTENVVTAKSAAPVRASAPVADDDNDY